MVLLRLKVSSDEVLAGLNLLNFDRWGTCGEGEVFRKFHGGWSGYTASFELDEVNQASHSGRGLG